MFLLRKFTSKKQTKSCTSETKNSLLSKIIHLLEPESPIFFYNEGAIQIKHSFYPSLKNCLENQDRQSVEFIFEKRLSGIRKISQTWNYSDLNNLVGSIKFDMQSSRGILNYFIKKWCQFMVDSLIEIDSRILLDEQMSKKNLNKKRIKFLHKNLLVFLQFIWKVSEIFYDRFLILFNKEYLKFIKEKEKLKKRVQNMMQVIQRQILSFLTCLNPFKQVYKVFINVQGLEQIEIRNEDHRKNFQKFLLQKFNIEKDYREVFQKTFKKIRLFHESPYLKIKFMLIIQFMRYISQDIQASQNQKVKNPENIVLEMFTSLFKYCIPESQISFIYIDIFLALKCESISWNQHYKDMENQLEKYLKLYFPLDDFTNHYIRLIKAYSSKMK